MERVESQEGAQAAQRLPVTRGGFSLSLGLSDPVLDDGHMEPEALVSPCCVETHNAFCWVLRSPWVTLGLPYA